MVAWIPKFSQIYEFCQTFKGSISYLKLNTEFLNSPRLSSLNINKPMHLVRKTIHTVKYRRFGAGWGKISCSSRFENSFKNLLRHWSFQNWRSIRERGRRDTPGTWRGWQRYTAFQISPWWRQCSVASSPQLWGLEKGINSNGRNHSTVTHISIKMLQFSATQMVHCTTPPRNKATNFWLKSFRALQYLRHWQDDSEWWAGRGGLYCNGGTTQACLKELRNIKRNLSSYVSRCIDWE
jgi:hypothetical protein